MFNKLFEAQEKAQEIKKRLDHISVSGEAEGGVIKVIATANKEIREISIESVFLAHAEKEELEELLIVAVNKALAQAENVSKSEMEASAKDMLGGLSGLGGLGGLFGK